MREQYRFFSITTLYVINQALKTKELRSQTNAELLPLLILLTNQESII